MEAFNYISTLIVDVPVYLKEHPIHFAILLIVYMLLFSVILYGAWKKSSIYKPIFVRGLWIILAILSCAFIFPIGIVFLIADEICELNPNVLTNQFYVEIIIVTILSTANNITAFVLDYRKYNEFDEDVTKEFASDIFTAIVVITLSILCIFTDIEKSIQNWGFTLFGKSIGQWIYNAYLAWTLSVLLTFVHDIIELPFILLFGSPLKHFEKAFD